MTRTKGGIRQLKLEELSHISFSKERPEQCKVFDLFGTCCLHVRCVHAFV